jgi:hypothetical protein
VLREVRGGVPEQSVGAGALQGIEREEKRMTTEFTTTGKLVTTKKTTEMFGFRCDTCGAWYDENGNPYWSIRKTLGLHESNGRCGGRKKVTMYKWAERAQ